MPFYALADYAESELFTGFHVRFLHSDHMTLAFWRIDAGALLPEHAHRHEQVVNMLEGQFELTVAGETRVLGPATTAVIPSGVLHSGRAITGCRIIDVFHPVREDYLGTPTADVVRGTRGPGDAYRSDSERR